MPIKTHIYKFSDAISMTEEGTRSLLLGNGFSIALFPNIFSYKALVEKADFSDFPEIQKSFNDLKTSDFELVINALSITSKISKIYFTSDLAAHKKLLLHVSELKSLLINTIADNHPANPSSIDKTQIESCRLFLSNFKRFFTLNYDLLLYWVLMDDNAKTKIPFDDGFRNASGDASSSYEYVTWEEENTNKQNLFHLHGAFYIFDKGDEIQKFTWNRTGKTLLEQIRSALDSEKYPLIVAEGTSNQKKNKVSHSGFLSKGIRSLVNCQGSLFIYGHSLALNDDHIFKKIQKSKFRKIWVSIYGDYESEQNKYVIRRAESLFGNLKNVDLHFYEAESANIWLTKLTK